MTIAHDLPTRRAALGLFGQAGFFFASSSADSAVDDRLVDGDLEKFKRSLAAAPRRRSFRSVPLVVVTKENWDHEAAGLVLAYGNRARQAWECTELGGPWLNLMREAVNGQVFALDNPGFLAVAAVHGTAHLALFDESAWETHGLSRLAGGAASENIYASPNMHVSSLDSLQDPRGYYGPDNNNISTLQERGVVFIACHDSIHAIARNICRIDRGDTSGCDELAAELTNHLIPGAVMVPSVVAFLVELQRVGFTYAKGT
ncbi:MAG: transcriptional initiation protein Tat [Bradyrhizobium sp.]